MYDYETGRSAEHSGYSPSGNDNSNPRSFVGATTGINPALAHWLMQSLDHVGRGMLLVGEGGQVLHANRLARSVLAGGGHALQIDQGRLCMGNARDDKLLHEAIHAALHKGLRRMLTLGRSAAVVARGADGVGQASAGMTVAVLPIEDPTAHLSAAAGQPGRAGADFFAADQPQQRPGGADFRPRTRLHRRRNSGAGSPARRPHPRGHCAGQTSGPVHRAHADRPVAPEDRIAHHPRTAGPRGGAAADDGGGAVGHR
jgi:hypothetical protein